MGATSHANELITALGLNPQGKGSGTSKSKPKRPGSDIRVRTATINSVPAIGGLWATLLFDGEQTAGTRLYPCVTSYHPAQGDRVVVALLSHSGVILGALPSPSTSGQGIQWQTLTYQNGYSDWTNTEYAGARYFKDSSGVVRLDGLVTVPSSPTVSQTIFQLPAGYRPSKFMIFPASVSSTFATIEVHTDGSVTTSEGSVPPAGGYLSLASISFPAEQ